MTHDELLMLVTGGTSLKMAEEHLLYRKVLLAVVELHKPSSVNAKECETCTLHTDYSDRYIAYPCETIQAIEKELS